MYVQKLGSSFVVLNIPHLARGTAALFPVASPSAKARGAPAPILSKVLLMARPKKGTDEKRDKWLPKMRVTLAELCAIKARAAQAGMSLSDFMRQTALCDHVIVREPLANIALISKLDRIATSLHANANNVNQQTKNAHIFGQIDEARLAELVAENKALNARIDAFLSELGV